jgi:CheY-like chemotaxis protein
MSNRRVLVVEDDPDGQQVVSRILRHHNITVDIASSAEQAMEFLGGQSYSLAILDLNLPRITGWELLETIRSTPETQSLPCVAVTAFHSPELAIKAVEAGFTGYLPKPLEVTSLMKDLEPYLT